MDTKLVFGDVCGGDVCGFKTPMLAVFAVDLAVDKREAVDKRAQPRPLLLTLSKALADAASSLLDTGEFKAGLGETALLHAPDGFKTDGLKAQRLLLVGLGKARDLSLDTIRKGAGTAVCAAKTRAMQELAIALPQPEAIAAETPETPANGSLHALSTRLMARAMVEGAVLAEPDWDTYATDSKAFNIHNISIISNVIDDDLKLQTKAGFNEGLIVAEAQNFARSLVNEPGNILTPTELGARARAMCEEAGLDCQVYSTEKIRELKMESFWAVAKGSSEPPALIVMTYQPSGGAHQSAPVLGLVGKGITFDTGGISIKPAEGMEKMKYDMAGAAAMIGAMYAIARIKPAVKVIAVVCSAENMPGGRAMKPGDVVTAMSGTTVEIVNTDAEGRLVLADGLHYAKTLGATHLIDAATLTGACVVALGKLNAGLFSNNEDACEKFVRALKVSGEQFWRLPCTDDYRERIASEIADIRNTGKDRWGGAITAAMFLKHFAGETPWVHLDIAGCAWNDEKKPWIAYGPSGVAVRSIVEWVRAYSDE